MDQCIIAIKNLEETLNLFKADLDPPKNRIISKFLSTLDTSATSKLNTPLTTGMGKNKTRINLVVIGHVDAGKSTTTGHLIYKCGGIDPTTLQKLEEEAKKNGKDSLKFAYIVDILKAERERGITIDISRWRFETVNHEITIIDVPGHKDFIKNMITGTSQADAALLVISAAKSEFEVGISPNGQTKEHVHLANTLGIKQLIVAINKMDSSSVNWSQERFEQIKEETLDFLKKIKKLDKIKFIPISGWKGDNLTEKSKNCIWYKGPTLLEALDSITPPKRPTEMPLRIPIQEVYNVSGIGTLIAGRVETGTIKFGDILRFAPCEVKDSEVKSILAYRRPVPLAIPGDDICVNVTIHFNELRRGDVAGNAKQDPPQPVESFIAQIVVLNHEGEIRAGYCPIINCHTCHVSCRFEELQARINKRTGKVVETNPKCIKKGDIAIVKLVPCKPMCVEEFAKYPTLGRFVVRDMNSTKAVGVIKKVNK